MRKHIYHLVLRTLHPHRAPKNVSIPSLFASSSRVTPLRGHLLQNGFLPRFQSHARPKSSSRTSPHSSLILATTTTGIVILITSFLALRNSDSSTAHAESPAAPSPPKRIRLAEVRTHNASHPNPWVTHGARVYDITDWVSAHPGGDVILRAAGAAVDPYWDIFSIHKSSPDVQTILESYFIGELDPADLDANGNVPSDSIEDPFVHDPVRDGRLLVHTAKPCNAETPASELRSFVTPNETFYVRQHLWVPECTDPDAHLLQIELHDGTEVEYTLADLKAKFPPVTITATLQCSGNRRKHMSREAAPAAGLQWDVGAISTAEFTGVRLRDVLADAGFPVDSYDEGEVKHAQFVGKEAYGSSIPIDKAVSRHGDVLLVYEMGGKPLPPDHGFPLRVLAPGIVAARSVKWLSRIVLSEEESGSQWQQKDYKCFGPNVKAVGASCGGWDGAPAIQEMPVQSAITGFEEKGGQGGGVEVQGYAYSGAGRRIVRVDVSTDGGRTWGQAELVEDQALGSRRWAWTRWRYRVDVEKEKISDKGKEKEKEGMVFVCKAVDEGYNSQPEAYEPTWNFRGNLTSCWHRVAYGSSDKSGERVERVERDTGKKEKDGGKGKAAGGEGGARKAKT